MKLENFILEGGYTGTTLFGLGRHWDLRSFAELRMLRFEPKGKTFVMEWSVPVMVNPWGSPGNRARGCRIVFEGVGFLRMTGQEADASLADDASIADVARIVPGERAWSWVEKGAETEHFRLLFRFQSGRKVEVESEVARLEPMEDAGGAAG